MSSVIPSNAASAAQTIREQFNVQCEAFAAELANINHKLLALMKELDHIGREHQEDLKALGIQIPSTHYAPSDSDLPDFGPNRPQR